MVVGDIRKYLTCLITLKCKLDQDGIPTNILDEGAVKWCQKITSNEVSTVDDFKQNSDLIENVQNGLNRANEKATANPHKVQKFSILPKDFSIHGGELGPTLKLKRHFVLKQNQETIEKMYA